jgi:uncharacterized membrane protein YidH (DUF202 family)
MIMVILIKSSFSFRENIIIKKSFIIIYKMNRNFIRENITLFSVALFIIIFGLIQMIKPACFYNKNGSIREFGVGYRNKTILPIWLLSLVLGILCYLAVMFYVAHPKLF